MAKLRHSERISRQTRMFAGMFQLETAETTAVAELDIRDYVGEPLFGKVELGYVEGNGDLVVGHWSIEDGEITVYNLETGALEDDATVNLFCFMVGTKGGTDA